MMNVEVSKVKCISRWVDGEGTSSVLHEIESETVHKDKEGD